MAAEAILSIRDLAVQFTTEDGIVQAVDGITYDVYPGETVGIVGESGSGKSVSTMSILGLIPQPPGKIVRGEAYFNGKDLLKMSKKELRHVRGSEVSMVFQDPMTSLNPVLKVGYQIGEAVKTHHPNKKDDEVKEQAVGLLRLVGVPNPERRYEQYPHEFSGGMRQRAMIAMALVLEPDLLIADEPTTALDVTVQAQILELIGELKERLRIGVVLISHNLGVIADVAQDVMIMYAGRPVEIGTRDQVFREPRHPYAWGLLESIPRPDVRVARLQPIEGAPPSLIHVPPGCAFHPRCPHRFAQCDRERPDLTDASGTGHPDACLLSSEEKQRLWAERRARFAEAAA